MNSQVRKLAIIAFAAALPLGLAAQSSTGSSSGTSGTSGSSSTTRSGSSQSGSTQSGSMQSGSQGSSTRTGTSGTSGTSSTASGTHGSSSGAGYTSTSGSASSGLRGISRVKQDALKRQFTATDLIGKDVYDNGGKKLGEVKDVVLGSAAGSHLAMAFASGESDDQSASTSGSGRTTTGSSTGTTGTSGTGSTYGSTSTAGSTGDASRTASTGTTGTARSSTSGSGSMSGSLANAGNALGSAVGSAFDTMSGMASEPAAIVSLGGFMGMGDNLVRVPLSQLSYDSSNERLTLAVSETEISSLTEDDNTSRQAAE